MEVLRANIREREKLLLRKMERQWERVTEEE